MENNKILKIIIPVVAIIVIIESLVLVKDLKAKKVALTQKNMPVEVKEKAVVDFNFVGEKQMMVGDKYSVELLMTLKEIKSLDSISSYIKYDKNAFEVSNLSYDKDLPVAIFSKISPDTGLIVGTFMFTEANGYKLDLNKKLVVAKFDVIPKIEGNFSFEVDTGNLTKESVTMIVDNASKKALPFASEKLNIISTNK